MVYLILSIAVIFLIIFFIKLKNFLKKGKAVDRKRYLFTPAERKFWGLLKEILSDYQIFAKVRLADVVYIKRKNKDFPKHLKKLSLMHVDFVICSLSGEILGVIELDDRSHFYNERKNRDKELEYILKRAGIPLIRIRVRRSYNKEKLRNYILKRIKD